jgi:hypothetical protein
MTVRFQLAAGLMVLLGACDEAAPPLSGPASAIQGVPSDTCPPFARPAGQGHCVLDSEVRIDSTIELGDSQTLDCKGNRILPAVAGSGTTAADFVPSGPEVAVAILGHSGASLVNCVLGSLQEPFDFPLIVTGSPDVTAGGNRIVGNTLHARSYGVKIVPACELSIKGQVVGGNWFLFDTDGGKLTVRRVALHFMGGVW